jgi:hypothetical protein
VCIKNKKSPTSVRTEIKDGRGRRRVTTLLRSFLAKEASVGCLSKTRSRIPITGNCRRSLLENPFGAELGDVFRRCHPRPSHQPGTFCESHAGTSFPSKPIYVTLYSKKRELSSAKSKMLRKFKKIQLFLKKVYISSKNASI